MQIVIENNRTLRLAQIYEPHANAISKRFRVKDPNARHMMSMRRGNWDGYHRYYKENEQTLNRGYLKDLIELCIENDFPYEIVDQRDKSKFPVPAVGSFDNKLVDAVINGNQIVAHEHQVRCWNSVCKASVSPIFEVGTHFHPTGGGKSLMMAGIVKLLRCPTVIITEQSIVLNQITKCLKLFNVVHHDDVGEFYSGKMPEGNLVCVGSIAALQTPVKPVRSKMEIKISTLKKDFDNKFINDYDGLCKIMSEDCINAWRRSCIIDDIESEYNKENGKKKLSDLVPKHKEWSEIINDVIQNIDNLFKTDIAKLEILIGKKLVEIWKLTSNIKDYEKSLFSALKLWHSYEVNKYFKAALKGYETRIIKSRELQDMVSNCELLLIDEMDNAASSNYDELFGSWFNGRYVHGFSGTPYDPDKPVEEMILRGRFGPVISKSTRRELESIGQIQPVKYYMFQFGDHDPKDKTAFDIAEKNIIINNGNFTNMISIMINNWKDEKHLIIVDTSNIEIIGKKLEEIIPSSAFIYGKASTKKRQKIIEDYENGIIKVLIVSKIGKRGMDLGGGTHNMYIIGGGKNQSNFDQIIGRAVRKNDRGWARVIDFYFTGNFYLLKHSRKRLKFITTMGYVAKVIVGKVAINAEQFVCSRYKIPKN